MENLNLGILFIFGISIFGGLLGASFFQKIRIPQVVGYIVIGTLLGESGFNIIKHTDILSLQAFSLFALGIIGFLVGGELKLENFKKYGRQFFYMLIGEGMLAFLAVSLASILFLHFLFHDWKIAVAGGIVLGAIASATDPASTINVLWEYRSLGILTISLTAIVALDDALAMTLYGIGTSTAKLLTLHKGSIILEQIKIWVDLLGAACLGYIFAVLLKAILLRFYETEKKIPFAIGLLLLLISTSVYFGLDVILTSMIMGFALVNMLPKRSEDLFKHLRSFSLPIYVLFFVLAGARISFQKMPGWVWKLVFIYIVCRSAGKIIGAYIGATYSGSQPNVRKYLGVGLFAQGGVAIGLSMMASQHLQAINLGNGLNLGEVIISCVAMTTFIIQLIGPSLVKLAIKLSGEMGRNITRDDILKSWKVEDVINKDFVCVMEQEALKEIAKKFMDYDQNIFPVIKKDKNLIGVISLNDFKNIFADSSSWEWLIASDIMNNLQTSITPDTPLETAVNIMRDMLLSQLLVVTEENGKLLPYGIIDESFINQKIEKTIIARRQISFVENVQSV